MGGGFGNTGEKIAQEAMGDDVLQVPRGKGDHGKGEHGVAPFVTRTCLSIEPTHGARNWKHGTDPLTKTNTVPTPTMSE